MIGRLNVIRRDELMTRKYEEVRWRTVLTSGDEIFTLRILASTISLLSHTLSWGHIHKDGNQSGPIHTVILVFAKRYKWDTRAPKKTTWIFWASNFSAILFRVAFEPLFASYMTTCPPPSKNFHTCSSQPSETPCRKAFVSTVFSPR